MYTTQTTPGLNRVPENDEEVFEALKPCCAGMPETGYLSAVGLYRCRRAMGDEVIAAYEYVLRVLVSEPAK